MTSVHAQFTRETADDGRFVRQATAFPYRLGSDERPVEPGRYHLYVSLACPWAQRSVIVRRLKGLDDVVTMSVVDPVRDERGWAFTPGYEDPVEGFSFLCDAYRATDPDFDGRCTVPALWDRVRGRIATNDFRGLDVQLATLFDRWAVNPDADLYPQGLRDQIDELDEVVYDGLNNGVYRAGFATSQQAYEEAFDDVFATLEMLDRRLADRRFLVGDQLTVADIRVFTTLVRFDAVYHTHFRCNLRRLVDHANLWPYARRLFQTPGFGETTDLDHIKRHYYLTHDRLNPSGIVPKGPAVDWHAPVA